MTVEQLRDHLNALIEQGKGDALVSTDVTGQDDVEPNLGFNELVHTLFIE